MSRRKLALRDLICRNVGHFSVEWIQSYESYFFSVIERYSVTQVLEIRRNNLIKSQRRNFYIPHTVSPCIILNEFLHHQLTKKRYESYLKFNSIHHQCYFHEISDIIWCTDIYSIYLYIMQVYLFFHVFLLNHHHRLH